MAHLPFTPYESPGAAGELEPADLYMEQAIPEQRIRAMQETITVQRRPLHKWVATSV